jgi:hypothetical protein
MFSLFARAEMGFWSAEAKPKRRSISLVSPE